MSAKTSAFAPKPYVAPNKPKPLARPSFLVDEKNKSNLGTTNKPIISTEELSSFQLRKSAKPTGDNDNKQDKNNLNEFQKITLKSLAERGQAENRLPSLTQKPPRKTPPMVLKKPPTDDELRVTHEEEKSVEQMKNELEIKTLPVGSVRNSKLLLFEKLGKEPEPIPVRRRNNSSHNGSFASTSSNEENTEPPLRPLSSFNPKAPPKISSKPNLESKRPSLKFVDTDAVPVIPISPTLMSPTKPVESELKPESDVVTEDDIYDDVQEKTNGQVEAEEEEQPIYDDVNEQQQQQQQQQVNAQQHIKQFQPAQTVEEQELYDDVRDQSAITTPTEEIIQDDIYNLVDDSQSIVTSPPPSAVTSRPLPRPISTPPSLLTQSVDVAPLKEEKPFDDLPDEKFEIPVGLEIWLENIVSTNSSQLKILDVRNNEIEQFALPPRQPIAQKDFTLSNKENTISRPIESEKDRNKREKREKKKEKEERKRRTKELKPFGLSPDVDLRRGESYICHKDLTTKEKLHVCYKTGDELTVIEVAEQYRLKGKMVVMNLSDKKVGYVSKADFNIIEDDETTPETPRANGIINQQQPSVISTDDLYDEIAQQPPPVPLTPRPGHLPAPPPPPEAEEESIYEVL